MRAVAYYFATTILAVILGIILVTAIHPGVGGQDKASLKSAVTRHRHSGGSGEQLKRLLNFC